MLCSDKLCQFMYQPFESHWIVVKRILRYLKGTITWAFHLQSTTNTLVPLTTYCDADWGSDSDERMSTSRACIFIGPNIIS